MSVSDKRKTRRLVKDMAVILVMAGAAGLCVNLLHPRGFVLAGRQALEARKIVAISAAEAKIKHDAGALFIDAREKDEYDRARIRGALNMPALDAAEGKGKADYSILDKPVEAVIYCDGPACGASAMLAEVIRKRGYGRTIYILEQGIPEWKSKGYPVDGEKRDGK
ncbi:MAG: rhodanese-like domain-containing protein [Spirochaetes bacterium]|nr:rhodanese-like domain-containing protein [Spirochaetota bacterium]